MGVATENGSVFFIFQSKYFAILAAKKIKKFFHSFIHPLALNPALYLSSQVPLIEPRPVRINRVTPVCQRHSEGLPEDTSTQLKPIRIPL